MNDQIVVQHFFVPTTRALTLYSPNRKTSRKWMGKRERMGLEKVTLEFVLWTFRTVMDQDITCRVLV
jgi:hypothetical protein